MKETPSVTEEVIAGACGLDGEALTHELLLENERLLCEVKDLRRQNSAGFWVWLFTATLLSAAVAAWALK